MSLSNILVSFSLILSFLLIYLTYINYKTKIIKFSEFLFWTFGWLLICFISLRPKKLDSFIETKLNFDVTYLINVVVIAILVYMNFKSYLKIKVLEKKIDALIRSDSLKKVYEKILK
tara:strand:- start:1053 stop:1403 length:351 start_codon:yes stop_codon:yes gene_type:complete